eukprot:s230_g2.t1
MDDPFAFSDQLLALIGWSGQIERLAMVAYGIQKGLAVFRSPFFARVLRSAHEFSVHQSLLNGQNINPDLAKGIGPCPIKAATPMRRSASGF